MWTKIPAVPSSRTLNNFRVVAGGSFLYWQGRPLMQKAVRHNRQSHSGLYHHSPATRNRFFLIPCHLPSSNLLWQVLAKCKSRKKDSFHCWKDPSWAFQPSRGVTSHMPLAAALLLWQLGPDQRKDQKQHLTLCRIRHTPVSHLFYSDISSTLEHKELCQPVWASTPHTSADISGWHFLCGRLEAVVPRMTCDLLDNVELT